MTLRLVESKFLFILQSWKEDNHSAHTRVKVL